MSAAVTAVTPPLCARKSAWSAAPAAGRAPVSTSPCLLSAAALAAARRRSGRLGRLRLHLEADALAVGIDVGLAGRDLRALDAALRKAELQDLLAQRLLEIEVAVLDDRHDPGADEVVVERVLDLVARVGHRVRKLERHVDDDHLRRAALEV